MSRPHQAVNRNFATHLECEKGLSSVSQSQADLSDRKNNAEQQNAQKTTDYTRPSNIRGGKMIAW